MGQYGNYHSVHLERHCSCEWRDLGRERQPMGCECPCVWRIGCRKWYWLWIGICIGRCWRVRRRRGRVERYERYGNEYGCGPMGVARACVRIGGAESECRFRIWRQCGAGEKGGT